MRQPSSQTSNSSSLKLHNLRTPKVTNQSQAQIIAANFTRCRSGKEGLLTTIRSTQAPVFSAKAGPTTPLNVSSKRRKKAVKRKLNKYLSGELATCSKTPKKSTVVRLLRAQYASPLCKKFQPKQIEQESKFIEKHSKRQRKGETFTEDDMSRIKKRVKYLLNRMNKEQNLIDAYSAEGWKGQSREKLRPESELQKAKAQILRFQHGIQEAMHELDLLGLEGTMKEYLFDSCGQIYHEDIFCAICKRQDVVVNNDIILCDGACDRAFHQLCLRPPLRTDEIPPDDEGWLCPICDCKSECLDAINAYSGTSYGVEDSWKNIFAEAGSFGIHDGNVPQVIEDWPSEDSEDADYIPGQKSNNSKLGTQGQEGSIDQSVSLTSSAESGSDSNAGDDAASRLSLLNELAEIMEIRLGIEPKEDNVSVDEEDVILMDGKRRRKEVDYKRLHDKLRAAFKENPLPSRACKERLSKQLGLSFGKVHVWFKNVRCAALKKGLIQRAKGRGKNRQGAISSRKAKPNFLSSKVENGPEMTLWLALMDMVSAAQLKLETLRSRLQQTQAEGQGSNSLMYVAVAELKERIRT
ncbi:hypothetical protein L7F22_010727 [Adiantum nelumboides]|nr:hypothetical protein [Adiantum nelumboides]